MNGPSRKVTLTALAILFLAAVVLPAVAGQGTGMFSFRTVTIAGNGTTGPYLFGSPFIAGTVTATCRNDSTTIMVTTFEAAEGIVYFNRIIASDDSVTIHFATIPSWLRNKYTASYKDTPFGVVVSSNTTPSRDKTPKSFPGLQFGGSKTFDISVGSDRQTSLNQTLRLAISGNLTEDITLNAVVSDQNVPITPEGDTRELNELDRVLIELRGKHFRVDMGDTDLNNATGRWLGWSRRLSGATAGVSYGGTEAFASGAVSEGRRMSATISPIEGNQGPYRLVTENGRSDISIVPGTEKVWINGQPMIRGINDDYVIDYSTGELTFTENRIIGADMRIVCDYEYTSESYRRTFYSGGAKGTYFGGKIKVAAAAAREADDPDRPVLVELDDTMKRAMKAAGDSSVVFSGIRPAENDTTGVYDRVDGILIYNPLRSGKYNVTFSWVGENKGSYRYKGGGVYEFVPESERTPGSGASYEPVVDLPGPSSHSLGGATLSFDPAEYIHIGGETAVSSFDANSMSSLDDGDNDGGAWNVNVALSPTIPVGVPLALIVKGDHRSRGERFRALDRDRSAEENRRWGFPIVMEAAKEIVSEYSGGVAVNGGRLKGTELCVSGGRFELGEDALSTRTGVNGAVAVEDAGSGVAAFDHIVRDNVPGLPDETIDRLEGNAAGFGAKVFTPKVRYEGETRTGRGMNTHGISYGEVVTGLSTPGFAGLTGTMEWLYRVERAKKDDWADSALVRGGSLELSSREWKSGLFRARYARRERIEGGQTSASDQGLLETAYRPEKGAMSFDLSYRAGRSRETIKQKNFIYTGGGRGSYRWDDINDDGVRDPEEFIPDEHGSYYLYEETLDSYRPVNTVAAFGKIGLTVPGALVERLVGHAFNITTETSFDINERSSLPASDVFLLKLWRFRRRGLTTSGDARFQEDVTVPILGDGSLRLRVFRYASYEGEYVSGAERRSESEESVRLRLPLTDMWDFEGDARHGGTKRTMELRSSGDFTVDSWSGDIDIAYYPIPSVKAGLAIGCGHDRDDVLDARAQYYTLKPAAAYYFSGKGRIEASYIRTSVAVDGLGRGRTLPYTMARGRMEGDNHDITVTCDYRLSHRMTMVASYSGRKFADRDFEQYASTQLRAMF